MIGIAEMFAELDGYDRYDAAIELWGHWYADRRKALLDEYRADPAKRAQAVRRVAVWRTNNRERTREINREAWHRMKVNNPEKYKQKLKKNHARWKAKNPERARELNRQHQAARRARLKAAAMQTAKEAA